MTPAPDTGSPTEVGATDRRSPPGTLKPVATPISEPYRLTRSQVAYWGAREYVRRLWWAFVAIPLFGVLALAFGQHPVLQVMGLMAIVWPITIPGRSMLATRGVSRRLTLPTRLLRDDEHLYFATEPAERSYRKRLDGIRSATIRVDALAIEINPLGFAFVPLRAIGGREGAERLAASLVPSRSEASDEASR